VKQLTRSASNTVFATCRDPNAAAELKEIEPLGKLHILQLDVTSEESVTSAAHKVSEILGPEGAIDYLLNNAGNGGTDDVFSMDSATLMDQISTHVIGPLLVTNAFIGHVERSTRKVVANMTSGLGSIALDIGKGGASYCIAKCAQNMLTHKQSNAKPDVAFLALSPGWVKTDLGGPHAPLEVGQSVRSMIQVMEHATVAESGKFLLYDGTERPW